MLTTLAAGVFASLAGIGDVRTCVEAHGPRVSMVEEVTLTVADPEGEVFRSQFRLIFRQVDEQERRVLVRFSQPEDLAGAAMLIADTGNDRPTVDIYLPELQRTRRLLSEDDVAAFLGRSQLGVEELRLLVNPMGDPQLEVKSEAEAGGRQAWLLEARADASAPPHLRLWIDQERCIPIQVEVNDDLGKLRRWIEMDPTRVERQKDAFVARDVVIRTPEGGSETRIQIDELEIDVPIAAGLLTRKALAPVGGR